MYIKYIHYVTTLSPIHRLQNVEYKIVMNDDFKRESKKSAVAYSKVVPVYLLGGAQADDENCSQVN